MTARTTPAAMDVTAREDTDDAKGTEASADPSSWISPLVIAILGAITLVTRLPGLLSARAFNTDEATIAVLGRTISGSGSLYVNATDHKPPLVFAWYGAVQWITDSVDLRYVRLTVVILILATAVVLGAEADRRWGRTAGWVTAVTTVLASAALGPADAQAANFEVFTLLPIAVGFVAASRGRPVVAGVALAVATLSKQPAAVTAIPIAVALWRVCRVRGVVLAGLTGAVSTVALAAPFGLGAVLEWGLLRNDGYLAMSVDDILHGGVRLAAMVALAAAFWAGAWLLIAGGTRFWPAPDPKPIPAGHPDLALWLLLGGSFVATVPGLRFFPHYLLQLVPAVALLAGLGASRRPALVRPALAIGVAATTVAVGLAWHTTTRPVAAPEEAVADYVRAHSRPGDTILVWGNMPEIYWRADRFPAGALTHNNLLTGYSGRRPRTTSEADIVDVDLYQEFVDRVQGDRPVLIVDVAASGVRGGETQPLAGYPLLTDQITSGYRRVATVAGAPIYELMGGSGP